ncbi:hypothetical protein [Sandaracinus amylolyticus]|uniref:hypothetical protein n=1 Tax=Sandaracinus amylolyticus TaxID=927083 RepID=UPI001F26A7CC|nr:hypothetical protein [Sandaracinus amylolyticus]UJR82719.1 Hypothetical protein I5071_47840 [Sandaracinus amylolyticus]
MEPSRVRTEGALGPRRRLRPRAAAPAPTPAEAAKSLDEIRRIVVGDERTRIDAIEAQQPFVAPRTVGGVLPEAVETADRTRGHELSVALERPVTESVRSIVRRDADLLAEILSPTIGVAVRRAVSQAFAALLQRIDTVLERSLSPQSVRWRIEAWRTGVPFAEIVLARTLVYRVEQVFLIHSPSGVALRHVAAPGIGAIDPDQVASMLAAIDAFVVDAFAPGEPGAHVGQLEAGDLTMWIDRDAMVTVALVVRGKAPRELADLARGTRERIAIERRAELCGFSSDVGPFASTETTLSECLREVRATPPRRAHVWLGIALALLALPIAGALASWWSGRTTAARRLEASVDALRAEPGIVVISAIDDDDRSRITGLRDPLASAPEDILARRGLAGAELAFAPFESRDPRLAEQRVRAALDPPPSVRLSLEDRTLRFAGEAPPAWIDRTRVASTVLSDVDRVDESQLRAVDERAAIEALEGLVIPFAPGSAALLETARASLDRAAAHAGEVIAATPESCVVVSGGAEERGGGRAGALRVERARAVVDALRERGVPERALMPEVAAPEPRAAGTARRATFEVRPTPCEEARP